MEAASKDISSDSTAEVLPESSSEISPAPLAPQKKSKKEEKASKKDDKSLEQFLKSLDSIPNSEERVSLVCKKYVQSVEDNKKLQYYVKQSDKRHAVLQKEKDHLQQEFNKTILVKSKLENLCRELQKQNKAIKEESLLKIREEEERRKETQAKFQNTLSEITTLLQQNNEKNAKLRDDNISMSEKFKSVVQQYQLREEQVDKMAKQMSLESQLSDAKLQKASLEHQAEKEKLTAEMEQMKVTLAQYRAKVMELQGNETLLKGQLAIYTEKYDEFQNALVKSNQVFTGFKEQMEMMSKKIKKLEKESLLWKKKFANSQTALLEMCGERQASEERVAAVNRQLLHMQSLCRTLQAERTALLNTLKANNIERPPVPAPVPVTAPPPPPVSASDAKVDAMVANCAQLRQSLVDLQTQLNVLSSNKTEAKEESPKPEKGKKKSKKSKLNKQSPQSEIEKQDVKEDEPNPDFEDNNAVQKEVTDNQANTQNEEIQMVSTQELADKNGGDAVADITRKLVEKEPLIIENKENDDDESSNNSESQNQLTHGSAVDLNDSKPKEETNDGHDSDAVRLQQSLDLLKEDLTQLHDM